MKDPYEVLGLDITATEDEIKAAYRLLVRKYHPDRYAGNPLAFLAQEKLKEINEAYGEICRRIREKACVRGGAAQCGGREEKQYRYSGVNACLNSCDAAGAKRLLEGMESRDAQWYFLMGLACRAMGWHAKAESCFQQCSAMEPDNADYRGEAEYARGVQREYEAALHAVQRERTEKTSPCARCCCTCLGAGD